MGGDAYSFSDATDTPPGGSSACLDPTALCGMGTSAAQIAATPGDPYGGGIGVNLNQVMGSTTIMPFTPTGTGVMYTLSSTPPANTRLVIGNGPTGTDYCAPITAITGTVSFSSFTAMCYNPVGMQGAAFTAADAPTHIEFQVSSGTTATPWNFCVTALSFQ
jgi:hypothetical protein